MEKVRQERHGYSRATPPVAETSFVKGGMDATQLLEESPVPKHLRARVAPRSIRCLVIRNRGQGQFMKERGHSCQ
jgi:hypothetical protein